MNILNTNPNQNLLLLYFFKFIWFFAFIVGLALGFVLLLIEENNFQYYGDLIFKASIFSFIILVLFYIIIKVIIEIKGEDSALVVENPFRFDQLITQLYLEDYVNFKHLAGIISLVLGFFVGYFY
ncbi:MAG: hypothetical protein ACXACX_20365 [Candidatus Hodarchaeales archaeon]